MILFLVVVLGALSFLLVLVTFVQVLYLESLRLRARETQALSFFRDALEARIGLKPEAGNITFSLVKHALLVLLGADMLGVNATRAVSPAAFAEASIFGLLTMFVTSYLVPQFLYRRTEGRWLVPMVPVLKLLILSVKPVSAMLAFLLSLVETGEEQKKAEEPTNGVQEIEALITAGAEEGILEETDRKLIHSVVAFGDKTVRAVMTPRPNMVAIDADRTLEDLRQLVIHEQFSRIPVFEKDIDHITGFVHVRDMFELDAKERAGRVVRELSREISFVPETKPIPELLREMQERNAHMVIVVDEYGDTAGLVTMEDLVEEILGEIRDEHEPGKDVHCEPDGSYTVSGSFDLDNLAELVEFRPPEGTEATTVGGLITEWLGRVPQVGQCVDREGIHLEVLAGNDLRVERVRVAKSVPHPETESAPR